MRNATTGEHLIIKLMDRVLSQFDKPGMRAVIDQLTGHPTERIQNQLQNFYLLEARFCNCTDKLIEKQIFLNKFLALTF